jgi:DNA-directed RNA polymerase subunit M/transcription elongation factor TFIIS
MSLPVYDSKATCPKCGNSAVRTNFHSDRDRRWFGSPCYGIDESHIDRTCERCHYQWQEAPLDTLTEASDHE